VDGDADAAVENRIWIGWNKFWQLVPLLTNNNISLKVRERLYSGCVWSSMLHVNKTWPVRKENEVALKQAEMRMVRWMCGMKLQDRIPSKGWRERLALDDIISVLQRNRLWWYGRVLRKEDIDLWRNIWSMKWRVPGQQVGQRKLGERLWKRTVRRVDWTGRMPSIIVDGWSR